MSEKDLTIRIKAEDHASGVFETIEKKLRGLSGTTGKRTVFGEVGELIKGGGAVAGVTILSSELGKVADEATRVRDEFNEGKTTVGQMTDQIIRAVPVLGSVYSAGRSINELLYGTEAQWKRINEEATSLDVAMKAHVDYVRSTRDAYKSIADIIESIERRRVLGALNGADPTFAKLGYDQAGERKTVNESFDREREKFAGQDDSILNAAKAKVDAAQKKVEELEGRIGRAGSRVAGFGSAVAEENARRIEDDTNRTALAKELGDARAELGRVKVPFGDIQSSVGKIEDDRSKANRLLGLTQLNETAKAATERAMHDQGNLLTVFLGAASNYVNLFNKTVGHSIEQIVKDAQARVGINRTLGSARIDLLRGQGNALGATQEELNQQFDDKYRELAGAFFDPNATADQRIEASRNLRALPILRQMALLQAGGGGGPNILPGAVDFGSVNTLALSARQKRDDDPQLETLRKQLAEATKQNAKLDGLITMVSNWFKEPIDLNFQPDKD